MLKLRLKRLCLHCVKYLLVSFLVRKSVFGVSNYRKVPKFSDAKKLCFNLHKIKEKRPNLWIYRQKDANGIANSEDPDQTAPLGAV